MNAPLTLQQLAAAWRQAKADEHAANARRVEIEHQICAAMPAQTAEDTVKAAFDDCVVRVTYKVSRSVDTEGLTAVWQALPDAAQKAFRWKAELNLKQLRALQELLPDEYRRVAAFIEAKPAKPAVTIEEA